ncbi:MAG: galactokinase [Planctomycetota bacterium]
MIDRNTGVQELVEQASREFEQRLGRPPRWITVAPGRVNLIGEHIDYNDGFVLPMAIERYVVLAADRVSAPGNNEYQLRSMTPEQQESWPADGEPPSGKGGWSSYVWGVLALCKEHGLDTGPLHMLIHSNVPIGGGLSSSAALEVATATLVEEITQHRFHAAEKALLCQKAEHEYAGVPCGIMDQFSSVMGRKDHLILLDCRSTDAELVPMNDGDVSMLIANTNVKHELTGGEYAERRRECEEAAEQLQVASLRDCRMADLEEHQAAMDPVLVRRARHVIGEIDRTSTAADTFRTGDWLKTGTLMYASHQSLKDDYEVSCDELDLLVELAGNIDVDGGVYGSRMTGAGFGGCTVSLVRADALDSIAETLATGYEQRTGIKPTLFVSRPAEGARSWSAPRRQP